MSHVTGCHNLWQNLWLVTESVTSSVSSSKHRLLGPPVAGRCCGRSMGLLRRRRIDLSTFGISFESVTNLWHLWPDLWHVRFLENCWLHDDIWTTKNEFSKNRGTRFADRYNRKRSLYSDCWSDLHRVRENWHAVRIFSKKNLWQLWIWWDLINKNERYRVVVRFACEEAVSGGVYIRAISQTFSCRNCSSISNLWQICDRICDNYLTNLSVLVGEILRPNRYLKNTSLFEIM